MRKGWERAVRSVVDRLGWLRDPWWWLCPREGESNRGNSCLRPLSDPLFGIGIAAMNGIRMENGTECERNRRGIHCQRASIIVGAKQQQEARSCITHPQETTTTTASERASDSKLAPNQPTATPPAIKRKKQKNRFRPYPRGCGFFNGSDHQTRSAVERSRGGRHVHRY